MPGGDTHVCSAVQCSAIHSNVCSVLLLYTQAIVTIPKPMGMPRRTRAKSIITHYAWCLRLCLLMLT